VQRVHCPRHEERTPSVVIYPDHGWCFGGCGRIPLDELEAEGIKPAAKLPPEDLEAMLGYINGLPLADVRGLRLPVDSTSYYIVWPGGTYYKRRQFIPGDGPKYRCPAGHAKPLFVPRQVKGDTLAIVEGELNALSLSSIEPPYSVCSPGGVGDFTEKLIDKCHTFVLSFSKFRVILDKDKPGLDAALRMKALLLKHTPHVDIVLMPKDCNELLVEGSLKDEAEKWTKL
jgi:hypothetical protein